MARYAILTYDENFYLPQNIRSLYNIKNKSYSSEVIKEYTRLRDIAQKRLKRMSESEFADTQIYRKYKDAFPKQKDLRYVSDLAYTLSDLARFVSSPQSTITGLKERRKKAVSTLHEHGYDFVTTENYAQFGEFMEMWREEKMDSLYDSGDAADAYYIVEKHGIDPAAVKRDFEFWLDESNRNIARKMKPSTGKSVGSARRLRDRIQKQKKRQRKQANKKAKGRRARK